MCVCIPACMHTCVWMFSCVHLSMYAKDLHDSITRMATFIEQHLSDHFDQAAVSTLIAASHDVEVHDGEVHDKVQDDWGPWCCTCWAFDQAKPEVRAAIDIEEVIYGSPLSLSVKATLLLVLPVAWYGLCDVLGLVSGVLMVCVWYVLCVIWCILCNVLCVVCCWLCVCVIHMKSSTCVMN